jgi:hypothetical protein
MVMRHCCPHGGVVHPVDRRLLGAPSEAALAAHEGLRGLWKIGGYGCCGMDVVWS